MEQSPTNLVGLNGLLLGWGPDSPDPKFITNRDNHAVRRAGTTMVGKAVPSDKGMEAWVEALFDQFYQAQLAESHVQEPGLGG